MALSLVLSGRKVLSVPRDHLLLKPTLATGMYEARALRRISRDERPRFKGGGKERKESEFKQS